jgi:hypothetical protein
VWQQDSCRIFIRFSNRPIHPMFEPPLAPRNPLDINQARCLIANFVEHYKIVHLHSAID